MPRKSSKSHGAKKNKKKGKVAKAAGTVGIVVAADEVKLEHNTTSVVVGKGPAMPGASSDTVDELKSNMAAAPEVAVDTVDDLKSNTTAALASENTTRPPVPTMWSSHQTHQFASQTLTSIFKFTSKKLRELMRDVYLETDGDVIERNIDAVLGKKPVKLKKIKDPNKPKKPLTGYQLWCRSFNSNLRDKPSSLIELSKLQSEKWRQLSMEDKCDFLAEAELLKDAYRTQMSVYNSRTTVIAPVLAPIVSSIGTPV